jgi:peroxin-1
MDNHKVQISYKPLRSNLINLPSNLTNLLFNANVNIQDVIIELILQSGAKSYTGWSGMSSSKILTLEIDPIFAQSLSLSDKHQVTLNLKLNNFETTQINLEPVTSSDWELVELHAQILEDKLLSQSRCVSLNQVLVVYPSQTTSAKLIVTDIGTKDHNYAKISPMCEVAIAPKVRVKKAESTSGKSTKSSKSSRAEDYSNLPSVLKRGISLPHNIFSDLPSHSNPDGYEIYVNFNEVIHSLNKAEYVAVSIVPGPNSKQNIVGSGNQNPEQNQNQNQTLTKENSKEKISSPLKETKRVIAKLVNCPKCPSNTVGLSAKLAVALNVEYQVGSIVVLNPSVKHISKKPSSFVIHPYILQTKKTDQINLNSIEKKDKNTKLLQALTTLFYNEESPINNSPITNYIKLPIVPHLLPNGGLLKFKRNDDVNAWIKPFTFSDEKKQIKLETGEELIRNQSFIQEIKSESEEKDEVIGLDNMIEEALDSITINKNSGTLIYGNSGSGKTLMLNLIASKINSDYGYHTKYISCEKIMNENFNLLSNNHAMKWIQECSWHKPSLLILDNLDKILPAEMEHVDSAVSNQLTEFLITRLQKIYSQHNSNLSILISATSKEALNKLLFQCHLLEHFHHLSPPDKNTRLDIINGYITDKLGCNIQFDVMDMVSETEGYLPNDLKILCDRIYHESLFSQAQSASQNNLRIAKEHFEKALKGYTPSNLRGVKLQKSSISWSDIGGLKDAKNILLETLEWPTKYAPIFANCPLRLRSGILLYGYPGCGKTLLASAIAGQCGLNFISIKGPEILNKYIGASEQSVRELFERAQSAKPCILFFDEFDSIAPKRGHDSTGVTDRVVNQMLTQMDGAEGLDGVYVLAATSRPDLIDSALLRPGRLDKSVICDMPSFEDRLDILESITTKMDLMEDVNLKQIAEKTAGFSGADMQGLGYNAYLKAVHVKLSNDELQAVKGEKHNTKDKISFDFFQVNSEKLKNAKLRPADRVKILQQIEQLFNEETTSSDTNRKSETIDSESLKVFISQKDLLDSLKETKPSISVSEKTKLQKIYNQFVSGRDGNMPDGTPNNEVGGRTTLM